MAKSSHRRRASIRVSGRYRAQAHLGRGSSQRLAADTEAPLPRNGCARGRDCPTAPAVPFSLANLYSRIFLYHTVSARGLEPSTELLGLFDGVERPDLGTVEDTLLPQLNTADSRRTIAEDVGEPRLERLER